MRLDPDIANAQVVWRFSGPISFEVEGKAFAVALAFAGEYQVNVIMATAEGEVALGTHRIVVTSPAAPTPPSVMVQASPPLVAQRSPQAEVSPQPVETRDAAVSPVVAPPEVASPVPALPAALAAQASLPEVTPPAPAADPWLSPQLLSDTPFAHFGSGDLDGDGYADLVAGHADSRQLFLFRGAGDGTFSARGEIALWFNLDRVLVADFAGSALADIVAVNWALRQAVLLVSTGPFAFEAPTGIGFPTGAKDVWAGQLNDHPASELVWTTANGPVVWSFMRIGQVIEWNVPPPMVLAAAPPPSPHVWADFTGDGTPEFAFYGHNPGKIFLTVGDSPVELATTPGRSAFLQLVAADVDGDGRLDLIGLDYAGQLHTLTSNERWLVSLNVRSVP